MDTQKCLESWFTLVTLNPERGTAEHPWRSKTALELSASSIFLLNFVPAARESVLDYISKLVLESVSFYLTVLEGTAGNSSNGASLEVAAGDLVAELTRLTDEKPKVWGNKIFRWSLDLLATICRKSQDRKVVPPASDIRQSVQLYSSCPASAAVLALAEHCAKALLAEAPEGCVTVLMDGLARHDVHFGWVLAHIGSQQPSSLITHLLTVGQKDFTTHVTDLIERPPTTTSEVNRKQDAYMVKLNSLLMILGHLMKKSKPIVEEQVEKILQTGLTTKSEKERKGRMPCLFLFKLLLHSPDLFQLMALSIVRKVTVAENLLALKREFSLVPPNLLIYGSDIPPDQGLAVLLSTQIQKHLSPSIHRQLMPSLVRLAFDDLVTFAPLSASFHRDIQMGAIKILDSMQANLATLVHSQVQPSPDDLLLVEMIDQDLVKVFAMVNSGTNHERAKFFYRYLCILAWATGAEKAAHIIAMSILIAKSDVEMRTPIALIKALFPYYPKSMPSVLRHVTSSFKDENGNLATLDRRLDNLAFLINYKEEELNLFDEIRDVTIRFTPDIVTALLGAALADPNKSTAILKFLENFNTEKAIFDDASLYTLSSLTSQLYFALLSSRSRNPDHVTGSNEVIDNDQVSLAAMQLVDWAVSVFTLQKKGLDALVAKLVQEAFGSHQHLFTGKAAVTTTTKLCDHSSLLEANLLETHAKPAELLHTGSLPKRRRIEDELAESSHLATLHLTNSLLACMSGAKADIASAATQSLVAAVCADDAIAACHRWESIEAARTIGERYLVVARRMDEMPHLLSVLELIAEVHPCLWLALPLVKAELFSILLSCEAAAAKTAPVPAPLRERLDRWAALCIEGRILPTQLHWIPDIVESLSNFEASVVLNDVWRYMQKNYIERVQILRVIELQSTELLTGDPLPYMENTRLVMQSNIESLGHLFSKVFTVEIL